MIKLIASDLDGTLLDNEGKLPEGIFQAIEKLAAQGILFCPASGRQLTALKKMFEPVSDKILIMAENGAIVSYKDDLLRCDSLPRQDILDALDAVACVSYAHPLLCTPDCAYYQTEEQPFITYVRASYISNAKRDLREVAETEKVCKIAVYDGHGPENNGMKILPERLPDLRIIQSGGNWLDISQKHADKGHALRFIFQKFGFSEKDCVAFGDHMNDYEMLLACGHPYVTENAYPPLKQKIGKIVPSNADHGVLKSILLISEGILP